MTGERASGFAVDWPEERSRGRIPGPASGSLTRLGQQLSNISSNGAHSSDKILHFSLVCSTSHSRAAPMRLPRMPFAAAPRRLAEPGRLRPPAEDLLVSGQRGRRMRHGRRNRLRPGVRARKPRVRSLAGHLTHPQNKDTEPEGEGIRPGSHAQWEEKTAGSTPRTLGPHSLGESAGALNTGVFVLVSGFQAFSRIEPPASGVRRWARA